jgi:hypothetical protein
VTAPRLEVLVIVRTLGRLDDVAVYRPELFGRESAGRHLVMLTGFYVTDVTLFRQARQQLSLYERGAVKDAMGLH